MEAKEMRISIEKGTIIGDLTLPDKPLGMVVFAHGSGSSRKSTRNRFVASFLHQKHFGTLLFDLLTEEEEKKDLVTAEYRFNIPLLGLRLEKVIEFIKKDPQLRHLKIGLFGSSTGAAAAMLAAAHQEIFALVSRGGRVDLAQEVFKKLKTATLLIVGSNDPVVLELNQAAYDLLHCDKELEIIEGATHLFEEEGKLQEVAMIAADWFFNKIGGR